MTNFFSNLFGAGRVGNGVNPDCHAKDPNNCRICHTGKFSETARKEAGAEKEDALTPAEKELARIKKESGKIGKPVSYGQQSASFAYLKSNHKPLPAASFSKSSHFGGIWEGSEYVPQPPPTPRTADEIEKEIAKAKPKNLDAVKALGNYVTEDGKKSETRISPLTGKPVSRELNTIINALMCGIPVRDHEITSIPEWQDAERKKAEHAAQRVKAGKSANTWSDVSAAREKIRKDVFAKITGPTVDHELNDALKPDESYEVKKGFRFDIVMGIPGSGKNFSFADRISHDNCSRLADADMIKRQLPGYDGGLGASDVHDESTFINRDLLDLAYQKGSQINGDNIVYQTMGSNSSLIDHIERAHDAGYKVHLHFCDIDPIKAKGRMLFRFMNTGRTIPLSVYDHAGTVNSSYEAAKPYADTVEKVRADAGKGIEPKEVEKLENKTPKRRAKDVNYGQYGLFGYSGSSASAPQPSFLETGSGDDDIPEWFNDPSFWDDPVGYEDKPAKKGKAAKQDDGGKRSGMSIEDIIAGKGLKLK